MTPLHVAWAPCSRMPMQRLKDDAEERVQDDDDVKRPDDEPGGPDEQELYPHAGRSRRARVAAGFVVGDVGDRLRHGAGRLLTASGARESRSVGDLVLVLLSERIERIHAGREPRLFDEEDGDAVADRIRQATHLGDEEVALLPQPAVRERAAKDLEELGVDGVGGRRFSHGSRWLWLEV